jgi:hypothetical protein
VSTHIPRTRSYSPPTWWTGDDTASAAARQRAASDRADGLLDTMHNALILGSQPESADLTAGEIGAMDLDTFARIRERAGLASPAPYTVNDDTDPGNVAPAAPVPITQPGTSAPETMFAGRSIESLSADEYAVLRAELGIVGLISARRAPPSAWLGATRGRMSRRPGERRLTGKAPVDKAKGITDAINRLTRHGERLASKPNRPDFSAKPGHTGNPAGSRLRPGSAPWPNSPAARATTVLLRTRRPRSRPPWAMRGARTSIRTSTP